jgi:hypothetical protein
VEVVKEEGVLKLPFKKLEISLRISCACEKIKLLLNKNEKINKKIKNEKISF